MTCSLILTYDQDINYNIEFEFNGKKVEENENHIIKKFQLGKNLTIVHIDKSRDEGEYSCVTTDQFKKTKSITKYLQVFNPPSTLFKSVNRSIEVNAGEIDFVKFLINYKASPMPVFKVINQAGKVIFISDNIMPNKTKYDVEIDETTIELTIKNPDIDDFGQYRFLASYEHLDSLKTKVTLIVNKKPILNFIEVFIREDDPNPNIMKCFVKGYPKANISWSE